MTTSRRSLLAAGIGLGSLKITDSLAASTLSRATFPFNKDVDALIRLSAESNSALMRGDLDRYLDLISFTEDFTLMSPFGGTPTRSADLTGKTLQAMGRFFRNGTLDQEVLQSYASPDLVVLAIIERARVEVGGLPSQEWSLRVTLVYRREGSGWRLAHRHADPLDHGINLGQAAALARGEAIERS